MLVERGMSKSSASFTSHQPLVLLSQLLSVLLLALLNGAGECSDVSRGPVQVLPVDVNAERFDADIVDVVRLVKHKDALLLHVPRHQQRDLRVDHVRVVVHDHVGVPDHVPGREVGAPPLLLPQRPQVVEGVHPRLEEALRSVLVEALEEAADVDVAVLLLALPHP
eukprot:768216-Hanusia_phi.AAC.2